jgi:NAD(P)-dependent dehydrogenase (short-subunit alcohol dehydrogenase family)
VDETLSFGKLCEETRTHDGGEVSLENKVALVTGAGSGIGRAAAILLAREGAKIGAVSHHDEDLKDTVAEIEKAGGAVKKIIADVSDPAAMEAVCRDLARDFGTIDIVFANAGINGVWAPIEELKPDEWDKTIKTNLYGTFYTIKFAVPYLKQQGGSIVITASVNGTRIFSNTGATAYSCTKAAQVAMAQMLAVELGPSKVRVNVICPGAIDTSIDDNTEKRDVDKVKIPVEFPEGEIPLTGRESGKADQVAQLVLFLASDASSHISGTPVWIDGAQSLLQG